MIPLHRFKTAPAFWFLFFVAAIAVALFGASPASAGPQARRDDSKIETVYVIPSSHWDLGFLTPPEELMPRLKPHIDDVIANCKAISRRGQEGTWITDEVKLAYIRLHGEGYAHSAETWLNGELVGGLYGIRLGKVFFGESMFSKQSNASKYAFISYARLLQSEGVELIDCQVYTEHLESLGARMMPRGNFIALIGSLIAY